LASTIAAAHLYRIAHFEKVGASTLFYVVAEIKASKPPNAMTLSDGGEEGAPSGAAFQPIAGARATERL
jgi:hypothetical protein